MANEKVSNMLALVNRAIRHVTAPSKERFFSSEKWNHSWSGGYDLNISREDARYATLMSLMCRFEGQGPILDVGCGDGLLEARYRKLSQVRITGFDYSATAIERAQARQLPNVDFICADSRTFHLDSKFSLIVLNESLYYVDDYLGMMNRLSQGLTSEGVIVVSMHDAPITRRIWKNILRSYTLLQGVALRDESTGGLWHIRALRRCN